MEEPRQSVRPLKTGAAFSAKIRSFLFQVSRSKTFAQRVARLCGKWCIWKRAQQSYEQPISVHGRMPVVTSVKCRREFARRRYVTVAVQHVTNFVWVFFAYARQRQFGEPFCCLFVEGRNRVRRCRCDRRHQKQDCEKTFHARATVIAVAWQRERAENPNHAYSFPFAGKINNC